MVEVFRTFQTASDIHVIIYKVFEHVVDGHLAAHSHRVWYRSGWGNNSLNSNDLRVFFHVGKSQS